MFHHVVFNTMCIATISSADIVRIISLLTKLIIKLSTNYPQPKIPTNSNNPYIPKSYPQNIVIITNISIALPYI